MTTTINGSSPSITFSDGSAQTSATRPFQNRIINGNFVIDQRNAGASVTNTASTTFTVDRWASYGSQASKFTVQQNAGSVTPPVGFKNYLGITSSSAYSITSTDIFEMYQGIEGFNIADLGWGTADAKTVTLSFWVRSSLTGTFGGALINNGGSRSYPFSYSISVANTWEYKTITIAGDTSGTWLTTNGVGITLIIGLGTGSTYSGTAGAWSGSTYYSATGATSVVGTNGATFYITGVQLEVGSTATSFDYRPYGTELQLCQRYCHAFSSYSFGRARDADSFFNGGLSLGTTMRTAPTLRSGATYNVNTGSSGTPVIRNAAGSVSSPDSVLMENSAANWTTNALVSLTGIFEAEL